MPNGKTQKMCKMRKKVDERIEEIAALVRPPRYVCRKCARVARVEDALCQPVELPPEESRFG
jgi:hypothetical protein